MLLNTVFIRYFVVHILLILRPEVCSKGFKSDVTKHAVSTSVALLINDSLNCKIINFLQFSFQRIPSADVFVFLLVWSWWRASPYM